MTSDRDDELTSDIAAASHARGLRFIQQQARGGGARRQGHLLGGVELPLRAEIRLCHEDDLEHLEWFGALRGHRPIIRGAFERQLRGENWMLVADVRQFPVGQIWVDLQRSPGAGFLWALRVMPPFKGLGIGRALLGSAQDLILESGLAAAEILVEKWNTRAQALYERSGFELVGDGRDVYETEGSRGERVRHCLDVFVLRKQLAARTGSGSLRVKPG